MSGRSAYVRAKNVKQADKQAQKQFSEFEHEEPYLYGYTGAPMSMSRPAISTTNSYMSPSHARRRSHSSAGSTYGYPMAPHLHKPRPIVIASAIEKSDFRTHLDGMSSSLRGKLGGLIKGNKKDIEKARRPRVGTSIADSDFDFQSRSTEVTTPSIGAVPSLSASTTPSEGQATYSSTQSHVLPTRHRQLQESVIHKIRRFEGGGKLPQLGWKSLSNVGCNSPNSAVSLLTDNRIPNCGMRPAIPLSTCTCVARGPNPPHRSGSTPKSLNIRGRPRSLISSTTSQNPKAGPSSTRTMIPLKQMTRLTTSPITGFGRQQPFARKLATVMPSVRLSFQRGLYKGRHEGFTMKYTSRGRVQRLAYIRQSGISRRAISSP